VLENVGTFNVVVSRDGGPPGLTVLVDYRTEDGSANAGTDFTPTSGTLTFYPGDIHQQIPIEIIDDDVFEEDEHFYVLLENLRVRTKDGVVYDPSKLGGVPVAEIDHPRNATVMILGASRTAYVTTGYCRRRPRGRVRTGERRDGRDRDERPSAHEGRPIQRRARQDLHPLQDVHGHGQARRGL